MAIAVIAAVSARNILGPRLVDSKPAAQEAETSCSVNPPSGPIKIEIEVGGVGEKGARVCVFSFSQKNIFL